MRKLRTMVFDDEIIVLKTLERFFLKRGYEVLSNTEPIVCPMYEKCADTCTQLDPCADVILTDFKMPKMTGIELLKRQSQRGCKLDARNKAVISAYMDEHLQTEIRELGCSFFEKPFRLSDISSWLKDCEKRIDLTRPLAPLEHQLIY